MSEYNSIDYQLMLRAIEMAKSGMFTTAPNPNVGCVIAHGEEIVGEGYHYKAGEAHAEVNALKAAGEKAKGATAYVTLEPCSHYGRTPPCSEALIKAGVSKVICAMEDPNPKVAGQGIQMLRQAGIEVLVGLMEEEAHALNRGFIKLMKTGLPFVQLKMAASIDGQTALANGQSQWITSPLARSDVQLFRAKACAVLSTSQTVVDDNASLNVRWDELPECTQEKYPQNELRQPVRVVLDKSKKLTPTLKLFNSEGEVIVVNDEEGNLNSPLDSQGQIDLPNLFKSLAKSHHINHVWVEAGSTLARSLISAGLVDELVLYLAPKIMGSDGKGLFGALGLQSMQDVIDINIQDVRHVGPDLRLIATLN